MGQVRWHRGFIRIWGVFSLMWVLLWVVNLWVSYPTGDGEVFLRHGRIVMGIDHAKQRAQEIEYSDPEGSRELIAQIPAAEERLAAQKRDEFVNTAIVIILPPAALLGLLYVFGWIARGFRSND
ncbi:hypothetical protein [Maritimibacter sp. 55A14]|uniref:hypothetical protein n=1 Tax=Maritimibacter sp. 55A14 TaxID=2174844 RepID=UPI0011B23912|nr:hypothetical protein [Maritimibacter sp. 55A14]